MAWTLLAHATTGGASTTTSAIDTSGAVLLVVLLSDYPADLTTSQFSDSAGNSWTAAVVGTGSASDSRAGIFYVLNPTTSAAHTVTTGSTAYPALAFHAWGGVSSPALDQVNSAGSSTGTVSLQPGTITPTANGELLLTALGMWSASTPAVDSGFSLIDSLPQAPTVSGGLFTASLIQATAAAVDPTWAWSGGVSAGASIASFKATAGGGVTGTSRALGSGQARLAMTGRSSWGAAALGRASGSMVIVPPPLPVGLGGPGRGPRPLIPVRGVFRHRWRRYRLSYRSLALPSGPAGWARARGGGFGGVEMRGLTSLPLRGTGGSRGRLGGTTAELIAAVARGIAAAFGRARLPGAVSRSGRASGAERARSQPAGFLGGAVRTFGAAAGRLAGVTGAIVVAAGKAFGASVALAAMAAAMTGRARSDAAALGRVRVAGAAVGVAHARGVSGGRLAPTLGALLAGVLRASAAGTGRLAGMTRALANGVLRGMGAAIGHVSMAGAAGLTARSAGAGNAVAKPNAGIVGRLRAAGASVGIATAAAGRVVTGAVRVAGSAVGLAAWRAAGTIDASAAASSGARAAMLGALAGWMRALGASFGDAAGGALPLEFDEAFWMLPPVTGLTMTALPPEQNAGPYT